jgi:hypothetical protein
MHESAEFFKKLVEWLEEGQPYWPLPMMAQQHYLVSMWAWAWVGEHDRIFLKIF